MSIGFHGKSLARGDFIARGLPSTFIEVWDSWLAEQMHELNTTSINWKAAFSEAPAWRFALGSDVVGSSSWAGVMVPSRDSVGRIFPFVVAASVERDIPLGSWFGDTSAWYDRIEGLARMSNFEDFDPARMWVALCELPVPLPATVPSAIEQKFEPNESTRYTLAWMEDLEESPFPPGNGSDENWGLGTHTTLFWAERTKTESAHLLVSQGLPKGNGFRALYLSNNGKSHQVAGDGDIVLDEGS